MFVKFFYTLKEVGIPVSPTAFLTLQKALYNGMVAGLDDFYTCARAILVKSERYFDLYDQVFAHHFEGVPLPEDEGFEIDEIARGSFKTKNPPEIKGTGYVVQSLEAALWAFYHSSCFEDGCLMAVNLGDDADTTGAVYGQLAGAFYGFNSIPAKWRDMIAYKDLIADFAVKLGLAAKIVKETATASC